MSETETVRSPVGKVQETRTGLILPVYREDTYVTYRTIAGGEVKIRTQSHLFINGNHPVIPEIGPEIPQVVEIRSPTGESLTGIVLEWANYEEEPCTSN